MEKTERSPPPAQTSLPKLRSTLNFQPSATSAVWFNGTLLTFGGIHEGVVLDTVHYLPLLGGGQSGWTLVRCTGMPPLPRTLPLLLVCFQRLFVVGGCDISGATLCDCGALSLAAENRRWSAVPMKSSIASGITSEIAAVVPTSVEGQFYIHTGGSVAKLCLTPERAEISFVGQTPSLELSGHRGLLLDNGSGLALFGGAKSGAPNSTVWVVHLDSDGENDDDNDGGGDGKPDQKAQSTLPYDAVVDNLPEAARELNYYGACESSGTLFCFAPTAVFSLDLSNPLGEWVQVHAGRRVLPPASSCCLVAQLDDGSIALVGGSSAEMAEAACILSCTGESSILVVKKGLHVLAACTPRVPHPPKGKNRRSPLADRIPLAVQPPHPRRPQKPHAQVHLRRKEQVVSRIVLSNLQQHGDMQKTKQKTNPVVDALQKTTAERRHKLDLSSCPHLHVDDLFLVQETLRCNPTITELDVSNKNLNEYESKLLLSIVQSQFRHVSMENSTLVPEGITEKIAQAAAANEAESQRKLQAESEKRERLRRKRDRKMQRKRQKQKISHEAQRAAVEKLDSVIRMNIQAAVLRGFIEVEQRMEWSAVLHERKRELHAIEVRMEMRDVFAQRLEAAEVEESSARDSVARASAKEWADLMRQERAEMRVLVDERRERKRQFRIQREAIKRDHWSGLQEIRIEEDKERGPLQSAIRAERKIIDEQLLVLQMQRAEEMRRRQAEEEARRLEAERLAKQQLEQERRHKQQLDDVAREESKARESILNSEREDRRAAKDEAQTQRREIERQQNYRRRCAEREAVNGIAPKIILKGLVKSIPIASGSTMPVMVCTTESASERLRFAYELEHPAYMTALRLGSPATPGRPPPTGTRSKTFVADILEPNEITMEQWVAQKTLVVGASLAVSLDPPSPAMTLQIIPNGFSIEGNAEGAGAILSTGEAEFGRYNVDPKQGVHAIDFSGCVTEELIIRVQMSFSLRQHAKPAPDAAPCVRTNLRMAFSNLSGGECYSTLDEKIVLEMRKPIFTLPHDDLRGAVTYVEGDGDLQMWKGLRVDATALSRMSLLNAIIVLQIQPYSDPADYVTVHARTGVSLTGPEKTTVTFNGTDFGEVVSAGPLVTPNMPKTKRTKSADSAVRIKLNNSATVEAVTALLRGTTFQNDSETPVDGHRMFSVGITFPMGFQSFCEIDIEMISQDDPTVIDFGMLAVPYRYPPTIPSQHEEYSMPTTFYFAGASNVFDVDTTTFTGGFLSIRLGAGAKPKDLISMEPEDPSIGIELEGSNVKFNGAVIGTAELSQSQLYFTFADSSIEAVQALFKTFTFSTQLAAVPTTPLFRTIDAVFVCGEAAPVRATCNIKLTEPLISIPMREAFWTYKEGAGLQTIGNFSLCNEDDGWDGGFIFVEFVSGFCRDDVLTMKESNSLKIVDEAGLKADSSSPSFIRKQSVSNKMTKSQSVAPEPAAVPSATREAAEVRSLVRKRVAEKVKQLQAARQKALEELRRRIIRELKRRTLLDEVHQNERITEITKKAMVLDGVRVGTVTLGPDTLHVQFVNKAVVDSTKARVSLCAIKRKEAQSILRHISYKNISSNPTELKKILRVTVSDGTPHTAYSTVEIEIQPSEDATQLRRLNPNPKKFRVKSPDDIAGFCPFGDVTLFDPDTFAFNGAKLVIELKGGGDPKGDQLGFLTEAQQIAATERQRVKKEEEERGDSSESPQEIPLDSSQKVTEELLTVNPNKQLSLGDRCVGTVDVDVGGTSSIVVQFLPLPEGIPVPTSFDQLQGHSEYISILEVEKVLQCITYTSIASKTKPGTRIYEAQVVVNGVAGKLKLSIDVEGPLLWNPEFGADLRYKEGTPPVNIFPKLAMNFTTKSVMKRGTATARIVESEDMEDTLVLSLSHDAKDYSLSKGSFYFGKDYIGSITSSGREIALTLDWASKATPASIVAFLHSTAFKNTSQCPSTVPRTVEALVQLTEIDFGSVRAKIDVVAQDDPTEIIVVEAQIEVRRLGPPVLLLKECTVVDPDTDRFTEPSYLQIQLNGALPSDVLSINGLDAQQSCFFQDDDDNLPAIARITRSGESGQLTVALVDCTLLQLQSILRRVQLQIGANQRDKATRKTVSVTLKTGTAPPFNLTLGIDVLPVLFDFPEKVLSDGRQVPPSVEFELLPHIVVEGGNYADGKASAVITIESSQNSLRFAGFSKKLCVVSKAIVDNPKDTLILDGKEVGGSFCSPGGIKMEIDISAGAQAVQALQKCLRSITVRVNAPPLLSLETPLLTHPATVELTVTDPVKNFSLTRRVQLLPPPPGSVATKPSPSPQSLPL